MSDGSGSDPAQAPVGGVQAGTAVVIGASGGIGLALVEALREQRRYASVIALARSGGDLPIDVTDEASIVDAAASLSHEPPLRLVLVATGLLHGQGIAPEKTYRRLQAASMLHAYQVNAVGPALVAKHMLPLLARPGRSVFAALSARVGSIGDNRSGGWHSYRASKAALNMILRNLAIELARPHGEALCVGLHPGTVATGLSAPFRRSVPHSGLFTPQRAATQLLSVIDGLTASQSGGVFAWDGSAVPP